MPFFIPTNSAPKTLYSTVGWRLENHTIGAMFKYMTNPVLERLVNCSPALSESTNKHKSTSFPRGIGASEGIISFTSPYIDFQSVLMKVTISTAGYVGSNTVSTILFDLVFVM
jgi:hypothetical protein